MSESAEASHAERLRRAVALLRANQRPEARALLRELIREDNDSEAAWLWMSVAVDTLDESAVCLDNVLRVNPDHAEAAEALLRIRAPQLEMQQERARLRLYRDMVAGLLWLLMLGILFAAFFTFFRMAPA